MRPDDFRHFKRPDQWTAYNKIGRREEEIRRKCIRQYEATYARRVTQQTKKLIKEAATKKPEFKPRWANDGVSVQVQAEKLVRLRHEQRLNRIEMAATSMRVSVIEKSKRDSELEASKQLRRDWKKATTRSRER